MTVHRSDYQLLRKSNNLKKKKLIVLAVPANTMTYTKGQGHENWYSVYVFSLR